MINNKKFNFRMATENDARGILKVYRPYVEETTITFEYDVPTLEDFKKRIAHINEEYPYIICEYEKKIVGYAYAHKYRERAAYKWNVELSVYVKEDFKGHSIGKKLYEKLMDILTLQNVKNVYGCVSSPNINSEKLHLYFGFKKVGTFENTGYKFGKWLNTTWFEKSLSEKSFDPQPVKKISEIEADLIEEILNRQ